MPLLFEKEGHTIIKSFFNVYNQLGSGFMEAVYQEALCEEFKLNNVPFQKEAKLNIWYNNNKLDKYYKADFICYDRIIIELKTTPVLIDAHFKQVINYLKATKYPLAYLVTFGGKSLKFKRIINTDRANPSV
jgi:GxxExxY protein